MKSVKRLSLTGLLTATAVCATMLMAIPVNAIGKPYKGFDRLKKDPADEKPAGIARAVSTSRNNDAVKIYPDIFKRKMHVVARDNDANKEIDFFVFDLQGTLVQNVKMKQKDHLKIAGLARGKYIYRVFAGDEETASGQFEIR